MRRKTEEKRQAILDAAREVFRESGFETSSMADVAARAEASKATVYSYFPSKEALLMEVILEAGREHGERAFGELEASESLATGLQQLGQRHLMFISLPETIATSRLAITVGERSSLGREFYARGPGMLVDRLAEYLAGAVEGGQLRRDDTRRMAEQLKALYEAGITERRLFGENVPLDDEQVRTSVERAVDVFLSFYATVPKR